jgi:hypothetical protein
MVMSVVLIPRERNNEAFVAWLEENIAPRDSVRQAYVRRMGPGWDLNTVMVRTAPKTDRIYWQVTIEDERMAMLFALKWS